MFGSRLNSRAGVGDGFDDVDVSSGVPTRYRAFAEAHTNRVAEILDRSQAWLGRCMDEIERQHAEDKRRGWTERPPGSFLRRGAPYVGPVDLLAGLSAEDRRRSSRPPRTRPRKAADDSFGAIDLVAPHRPRRPTQTNACRVDEPDVLDVVLEILGHPPHLADVAQVLPLARRGRRAGRMKRRG